MAFRVRAIWTKDMDMRASCHYSRFFLSGTASSPYVFAQVVALALMHP